MRAVIRRQAYRWSPPLCTDFSMPTVRSHRRHIHALVNAWRRRCDPSTRANDTEHRSTATANLSPPHCAVRHPRSRRKSRRESRHPTTGARPEPRAQRHDGHQTDLGRRHAVERRNTPAMAAHAHQLKTHVRAAKSGRTGSKVAHRRRARRDHAQPKHPRRDASTRRCPPLPRPPRYGSRRRTCAPARRSRRPRPPRPVQASRCSVAPLRCNPSIELEVQPRRQKAGLA